MLDITRASQFVPGSNLKGDVRGANWVLLMNRLELGRVLFLGAPTPATLSMVQTLAAEVMVWEPNASRRHLLQAWLETVDLSRVTVAARPQASWRLNEVRLDLLCHSNTRTRWPTSMLRDSILAGEQVYVETVAPFSRNAWARKMEKILGQIRAPLRVWHVWRQHTRAGPQEGRACPGTQRDRNAVDATYWTAASRHRRRASNG